MIDPLATIDRNKAVCTGIGLNVENSPDLNPERPTEAAFATLISEYYVFFRERIAADVSFLRSVDNHRDITAFDRTLYLLRTAKQHNDNAQALTFYEGWASTHQSWQTASTALAASLSQALTKLAEISARVRRDPRLTKAWKEHASVEPETIFASVCRDLDATFNNRVQQVLISAVRRRAKRLRPGDDITTAMKDFCAQEITAQMRSLPVPYFQVLDRLGVLGKRQARAALLMAYTVSAATQLRGEDFLSRVEDAWKIASS